MPKFVLSPVDEPAPERPTEPRDRRRKIAEALQRRANSPRKQVLTDWLRRKQLDDRQLGTLLRSSPTITGVEVIDVDERTAREIAGSGLGYYITPDVVVPLVAPRTTAVPTHQPDPAWHAERVGIDVNARPGTGHGVHIAVLDTGIDTSHPAFNGAIWPTFTFDGETRQATAVPATDAHGHGTHVAGILAAKDFGIAPGANLLSGIVFPNGDCTLATLCFAIEWAAQDPDVDIINVSGGIDGLSNGFNKCFEAIRKTDALLVCAIGNDGPGRTRSPANHEAALAIGASNKKDEVWGSSGGADIYLGYSVPDLVAPGVDVSSCIIGGMYQAWSGTSMAAPIVSGIAALLIERDPTVTADQLVALLKQTCVDLGAGVPPSRQGAGRVRLV